MSGLDLTVQQLTKVNLNNLRDNPEKVWNVANSLQQVLIEKTSKDDEDPAFWPGRDWVHAENSYPGDSIKDIGCLGCQPKTISVIEYNCATGTANVKGLEELHSRKALFSRLPSRTNRTLYVYIERCAPVDAKNAPRFRVTDRHMRSRSMIERHRIKLDQLSVGEKLKIFMGQIQWIFVLNASREFSGLSGKSMRSESS